MITQLRWISKKSSLLLPAQIMGGRGDSIPSHLNIPLQPPLIAEDSIASAVQKGLLGNFALFQEYPEPDIVPPMQGKFSHGPDDISGKTAGYRFGISCFNSFMLPGPIEASTFLLIVAHLSLFFSGGKVENARQYR
jgi:hypothetical protein